MLDEDIVVTYAECYTIAAFIIIPALNMILLSTMLGIDLKSRGVSWESFLQHKNLIIVSLIVEQLRKYSVPRSLILILL